MILGLGRVPNTNVFYLIDSKQTEQHVSTNPRV